MRRFTCQKVKLEYSGDAQKRPLKITGAAKVLKPYCKGISEENIQTFNEQMHNSGIALLKIGFEYKLEDVEVSQGRKLPFLVEQGPLPKEDLEVLLSEVSGKENLGLLVDQLKELLGVEETGENQTELSKMKREDLNTLASELGIESPEKFPKKGDLITEIEKKKEGE